MHVMINSGSSRYKQLDYSSQDAQLILKEVSVLIHDISTKYDATINEMRIEHSREIHELKMIIKQYELNNSFRVKLYKLKYEIKKLVINALKKGARLAFRIVKSAMISFGVKDRIRQTNFFKQMVDKGYIEKLKGRDRF